MIAQLEAMLRDAVKKYEECDEVIHDIDDRIRAAEKELMGAHRARTDAESLVIDLGRLLENLQEREGEL